MTGSSAVMTTLIILLVFFIRPLSIRLLSKFDSFGGPTNAYKRQKVTAEELSTFMFTASITFWINMLILVWMMSLLFISTCLPYALFFVAVTIIAEFFISYCGSISKESTIIVNTSSMLSLGCIWSMVAANL